MKKILSFAFVLAAALVIGHGTAHAQVATSTVAYSPGGYSTPCFYLRQTHEWEKDYICADADYSVQRFGFDQAYRESLLLNWRQHVFVDVPAKYGWDKNTRSY